MAAQTDIRRYVFLERRKLRSGRKESKISNCCTKKKERMGFCWCPWISTLLSCILLLIFPPADSELFLWPQPRSVTWGLGPAIPLSSAFHIKAPKSHQELQQAAKRYKSLIFKESWIPVQAESTTENDILIHHPLHSLQIWVDDLEADLQHGVDESYTLIIPEGGGSGNLSARTAWGAIHGLETFSQLVRSSGNCLVVEHSVNITDEPLYPYRGLLLDTSRNFYPVKDILRTITALSYNKLNVLHWHIADAYSFPIELAKEPQLAKKGSYGPAFTYSQKDVKKVIKHARSRGVRVVPGLNAPDDTASWGAAYPQIVTCRDQFWYYESDPWSERMNGGPAPGQLNPLLNKTYEVFKNVVDDMASMFPDNFFHGGGNGITPNCWNNSADIQQYLAFGGSFNSLLEKFISTTHPYITANQKTVVYWEGVLLDSTVNVSESVLQKSTTILKSMSNGPVNTKLITSMGYRTIVSSSDFYFLACGNGGYVGNEERVDVPYNPDPDAASFNYGGDGGSWCAPYKTWQRVYDYDITYNLTEEEAKLVLGGEVVLWSEQSDAIVMDSYIWPRASAMAETLWSGNRDACGGRRSAEAIDRLNDWRYRLVERGISAAPLQPLWCLKNPSQCNTQLISRI